MNPRKSPDLILFYTTNSVPHGYCTSPFVPVRFPILLFVNGKEQQEERGHLKACAFGHEELGKLLAGVTIAHGSDEWWCSQLWREMWENNLRVLSIRSAAGQPLSQQRSIAASLQTGSIEDVPYILFCSEEQPLVHESYKRLLPWRLARSFLAQAHPRVISDLCEEVEEFAGFFVGVRVALDSAINLSIQEMSFYEINATPDALRRIEAGEHHGDDILEFLPAPTSTWIPII